MSCSQQGGNDPAKHKRIEYVWDGLDPIAEYNMLNGQRTDFYRGAQNRLMNMDQYKAGTQGTMYWYHYNAKGDVAGLSKHQGQSEHNYRYDPYGGVTADTGNFTEPNNHYTLTGKQFDEMEGKEFEEVTGLVYFGARYYEPGTGVWMNQDSYRGNIDNPMSLQRFMYTYNNPNAYKDYYGFENIPIEWVRPQFTYKVPPELANIQNCLDAEWVIEPHMSYDDIGISYNGMGTYGLEKSDFFMIEGKIKGTLALTVEIPPTHVRCDETYFTETNSSISSTKMLQVDIELGAKIPWMKSTPIVYTALPFKYKAALGALQIPDIMAFLRENAHRLPELLQAYDVVKYIKDHPELACGKGFDVNFLRNLYERYQGFLAMNHVPRI